MSAVTGIPDGWISLSHDCPYDHDHETAWYCDDGGTGSIKLNNIQADIRALTRALETKEEA